MLKLLFNFNTFHSLNVRLFFRGEFLLEKKSLYGDSSLIYMLKATVQSQHETLQRGFFFFCNLF